MNWTSTQHDQPARSLAPRRPVPRRPVLRRPVLRRRSAFTAVELVIVVLILGILAAVVVPKVISVRGEAEFTAAYRNMTTVAEAVEVFHNQTGRLPNFISYATSPGELKGLVREKTFSRVQPGGVTPTSRLYWIPNWPTAGQGIVYLIYLRPDVAWKIENTFDDGSPTTGEVRLSLASVAPYGNVAHLMLFVN